MIDRNSLGASFIGQVHNVRTVSDGGGKITIEFGAESLESIHFIQKIASMGKCNFQVAFVALPEGKTYADHPSPDDPAQESDDLSESF